MKFLTKDRRGKIKMQLVAFLHRKVSKNVVDEDSGVFSSIDTEIQIMCLF